MRKAIADGACVNERNSKGKTPLHLAVEKKVEHALLGRCGHVVRLLINAGAEVNLRTRTGETALMIAANVLHPPALVMLVLNVVLMLMNMQAVRTVGRANTPWWLYVLIALQLLISLQYAGIVLRGIF